VDYGYHDSRVDIDQQDVKVVHPLLTTLAARFAQGCFPEHAAQWDIALCNYYGPTSTLGLHQDNSESATQLKAGHPVVSFSVGASCNFLLGGLTRKSPTQEVRLNSGDVLIFGGPSRLRYHGVSKIYHPEHHTDARIPFMQALQGGRLNFTLRKL
jgi:alkylated DNA repair protein (DNA oxidative demethylase)